jgi:hypothetical protein
MLWIFSCSGEHDVKRPACAIRVRRQSKRSTILAVFALGFLLALIFDAPAAIAAEDRLVRAAFFSDECRMEADALGIMQTSDANALLAAFATFRRNLPAPAASNPMNMLSGDCRMPVIMLVNLLRLNGIEAELVFASMQPADAVDGALSGEIDRILVYVTVLDRYFDPAVPLGGQSDLDRVIRERANRAHLAGPSLAGDAGGACRYSCMRVYTSRTEPPSIRVKTETIRER